MTWTDKRGIIISDMELREFEQKLKCGLGRCYLFLKDYNDRELYRPAVLKICLNNPAFDTQCEGTRAEYAYRLASLFGDDDFFVTRITEKLWTVLDDRGWDFAHLCDITEQFAMNGSERAENALREAYGRLYNILLDRKNFDGYDGACDSFERLCVAFSQRYGAHAYERIIADLGGLFLRNPRYGADDFDWFLLCLSKHSDKSAVQKFLNENSPASPAICAFRDGFNRAEEERKKLDEEIKAKLKNRAPITRKIAVANSEERKRAIDMLTEGKDIADAIGMLARNYEPSDKALLIDSLKKLEIGPNEESGWHGAVIDILDCFDDGIKLPREALEFIYENCLCSCCREDAVRAMGKRGWLTEDIKRECLYDSNPDITAYANRFFKEK